MSKLILAADSTRSIAESLPSDITVRWVSLGDPLSDPDAGVVVCLLTQSFGPAEFDALPSLKAVCNVATGYDNVDLAEAARRNIVVTNTPDVLTESTADLTMALILGVARRVKEGINLIESGAWRGWDPILLLGLELNGSTLGIVGAGRIGRAVAQRAAAFGMKVVYWSRSNNQALEAETGAQRLELNELVGVADVISIHLPLTTDTRGLIGKRELARMKDHAVLVNTSRGGIVDEAALVATLASGKLLGVGLDVFENEPRVRRELIDHPKILALPHVGSATVRTRRKMVRIAFENAVAVLQGRPPLTPVRR
ncbi:MAG: 2-hydroxyacid dehydrogenase [Gemmatimonadales bacterium]